MSDGSPVFSPALMLMLQRAAGNAAVAEAVLARRTWLGGAETDQERYDDALREKQEYIARGTKGPENFRASTGLGGFNVAYDPQSWDLKVILRGAVSFLDGIQMFGPIAIARQPHANTQAAASAINKLPIQDRAAAAADWQWGEAAKSTFLGKFEEVVRKIWSGQHMFHCSRPYWEDLGAIPTVSAEVHAGEKTGDDNMAMTVYKVPTNFVAPVGVVHSGSGGLFGSGSTDNTMTINSVDVEERKDDILNVAVNFDPGAATIKASDLAKLNQFAIRFKSGGPVCSICGSRIEQIGGVPITATVPGEGADPEQNARDRFRILTVMLIGGGLFDAAVRLQYAYGGPGGAAAQLQVGGGVPQIIAAHEAGHMFGLGDRYATTTGSGIGGTGPSVGLPSTHDQLANDEGLGGAKAANDDGIMSWGNEVRPADYATFLEAVRDVSGIDEWAYGPTKPVLPPGSPAPAPSGSSAPGDFPTPATPPPTAVA
jgi:hypothetical protein